MKLTECLIGTLVVTATALCGVGIVSHDKISSKNKQIEELTSKLTTSTIIKDSRVNISSAWILRNSNRISDTTAKQIAEDAFKYPNPLLILAIIEAESEFTPTAVSKVGAVGLGQIMYEVHKKDLLSLGIQKRRDLFDVDKNIKATSFVLQQMLTRYQGDLVKALHGYLGGRDGKYVARIFSNYVHLSMEIERDRMS